jgi:hypothetical protein
LISLVTGFNADTEDYFFIHQKDLNMETIYRKFKPALLIAIYLMGNNFAMAAELAPVGGYVYSDSTPLCALVISNGQSQFSCDGTGRYDMQVPLDGNGMITVQAFASGFSPFKQTLPPEQATEYLVNMQRVDQGRSLQVTASYSLGEEQRALVDGTVKSGGSPVCSLALANGQKTFSCGDDLGKYSLDVPLDENGNVTLMVFAAGFEPYKEITQVDPDSDGDGVKDRLDEDDDNDGIFDKDDPCPLGYRDDCIDPLGGNGVFVGSWKVDLPDIWASCENNDRYGTSPEWLVLGINKLSSSSLNMRHLQGPMLPAGSAGRSSMMGRSVWSHDIDVRLVGENHIEITEKTIFSDQAQYGPRRIYETYNLKLTGQNSFEGVYSKRYEEMGGSGTNCQSPQELIYGSRS